MGGASLTSLAEELAEEYERVRPIYERLASRVAERLEEICGRAGIKGTVSWRHKDVDSLVKTAIRKRRRDLDEIRDKAGARAVLVFLDDVEKLCDLIKESFQVLELDDKVKKLGAATLGYQGVHLEVQLLAEDTKSDADLEDLVCEIQIHTLAQHAWSEVSHVLIYKGIPGIPKATERRVMRLQVLAELFDSEVKSVREEIMKLSQRPAIRLLSYIEPRFGELAATTFDEELSVLILDAVADLYTDEELAHLDKVIGTFLATNESKLRDLYDSYRNDPSGRNPLLLQPESIVIFERLEKDRFTALDWWVDGGLEAQLLFRMAAAWGINMPVAN
jgi:ppGpp synthetase/RelA/SpoT-type nucleotidyltranferase